MYLNTMRSILTIILAALLFALPLKADNESSFWSRVPQSVKDRYFDALSESLLPWAMEYADSLDIMSRQKGMEELRYFAQHIRSYNAYFELDSLRFIALIDDCIDIAKEYDFTSQYLCDYLNKVNFYISIEDYANALSIANLLVEECQKTKDDSFLYYGYTALGSIYSETLDYDKSNDFYKLALTTFKEDEFHNPARAQTLEMMALNYFDNKDYNKAIEYSHQALEANEKETFCNAILALSYFHLDDVASFNYWADKFMAFESFDGVQDYYRNCIEIVRCILKKDYDKAIAIKDNTEVSTYYLYDLMVEMYKHKGDWEAAFDTQKELFHLQDSVKNATYSTELAQMDSQLSSLQKVKEQEKKIVRQNFFIALALVLIILISVIVYLIMRQMNIEMKAKQKELEASRRFRQMIENAPFQFNRAQLIYGPNHEVVDYKTIDVNESLKDAFKKVNRQYGQKTIMESYPTSAGVIIKAINDALSNKKDYARLQYHMPEYDQYYEMIIMFDGTDVVQIFSINMTELSVARRSLQKANEDLVLAKEKAEKSDRAKTTFLQNMSHEIRTPLNAIMGFSQLLSLPDGFNTAEEKAEYAEYVRGSSSMLTMLIDDILDISDADKGNYKIERSDVPCNLICKVAIKNVEYRTPPGVKMYMTSEVDDDYLINTDPRRVQQVIINYLTNACKHTKAGEIHVHVSLKENPGKVTFSVTDTGTGVPDDMAETIFERFTKVDAFVQGTGLGLNICSLIAEKLGGKVMLDTSYKNGARFLFIL